MPASYSSSNSNGSITPPEEARHPNPKEPCTRIIEDESLKSATAIHLEKIAQAFINAINARNFDTKIYPYKDNISSAFVGDLERPPGVGDMGLKGLEEQMMMYRYVTETYPDYWLRIFDLDTYVDEKAGKAMMYFNGETEGLGEGVKMPSLGTLEFQRSVDHLPWRLEFPHDNHIIAFTSAVISPSRNTIKQWYRSYDGPRASEVRVASKKDNGVVMMTMEREIPQIRKVHPAAQVQMRFPTTAWTPDTEARCL